MSSNKTKFALIDCNNFYVSCERVFDPRMCAMEVIVLSGNDGCVIARSEGAKDMGIKMGEPYFKIKSLAQMAGIIAKSSNLTLYGDMSKRVMNIISQYSSRQEVYSIDESFLEFSEDDDGVEEDMRKLRKGVLKGTGIPVCVGIGSTKTLAKLANKLAKKNLTKNGVVDLGLLSESKLLGTFGGVAVGSVWGIGQKYVEKLESLGVSTVLDFYNHPRDEVKNILGINGLRVYDELHGIQCFKLESEKSDQKQIVSSRTFGEEVVDIEELVSAVTGLARSAIKRLRKQGLYVSVIEVFCNTNPFKDKEQKNNIFGRIVLPFSTSDYAIIPQISETLRGIYKPGFKYKKGGVILKGLTKSYRQQDLFLGDAEKGKSLDVIGAINSKYGDIVKFGSELSGGYRYKTSNKSPSYTTDWDNLPKAR